METDSRTVRLLSRINEGDVAASEELLGIVYDELHRIASRLMAGERKQHTLQATALVHEAWIRLNGAESSYENRAHFLRVAARAMRRVLVDHARKKRAAKRGGDDSPIALDDALALYENDPIDLLALDEALARLEQNDADLARIVELRYFAGLTLEEAGEVLGLTVRQVHRGSTFARGWLRRELESRPMSDRWARLREIVEEGVTLPPAERSAWLDRACAGDAPLRREAEQLIESSLGDERYLEPPRPRPALAPGGRLDGFRLDRVIASGGMGTVFLAEQLEPQRRVALKVMRHGLFSPASAARFRYEVRVLAALQHPHIASMYQTGVYVDETGGELPWFAMEYVADAKPFTQWADDRDPAEVVRRFADVCDAVDHGHRKGVVHRDLKPDNLLVGADGRPRVIDFGIARATDSDINLTTHRTSAGEILGTLSYMSPEQVTGDIGVLGTRSDLYSLGVVLYEALVGALPYELKGKSFVEVAAIVQTEMPSRARVLTGDLETIVFKCLRKDPEDRYGSAAALAQDLRRYLAREPIEAHPPSVTYQLRMFGRRHRVLVTALVAVVVVSVTAAIVSAHYAFEARRAERAALDEKAEADRERDRSRALFDTLLQRSIATTGQFAPRLHDLPGGAPLAREMMEATLKDLRDLERQATDDPDVRRLVAMAYVALGDAEGNPTVPNLGNLEGASARYGQALEITRPLVDEHRDNEAAVYDHAAVLGKLGMMALFARDAEAARPYLEEARERLAAQCERRPERENSWGSLASTYGQLAQLAKLTRDWTAEREHHRRQLEIFQAMLKRKPEDETTRYYIGGAHVSLAGNFLRAREFGPAIEEYEAAAKHLRPLVDADPERISYRSKLALSMFLAAQCHGTLGNLVEGERDMRSALELYTRLAAQGHRDSDQPDMEGTATFLLAKFNYDLADNGDLDATERRKHLREALELYRKTARLYDELEKKGPLAPQQQRIPSLAQEKIEACEQALRQPD